MAAGEGRAGRARVLGVPVDRLTARGLLDHVDRLAQGGGSHMIAYVNAHCLNYAHRDPRYRRTLEEASVVYADGMGVVWASRLLGEPLPERVNLGDCLPELCALCSERGYRVYVVAGRPGIAARAVANLRRQFPALQVVGVDHGYGAAEDEPALLARIERAQPDVLLVGMGVPKQEQWIVRHRERLPARVVWGVGALFDYYAGATPRAPGWVRSAGLEWLFRLCVEPARLWRRYLLGNALFVGRVARQAVGRRFARRSAAPDGVRLNGNGHSVRPQAAADRWFERTKRAFDLLVAAVLLLAVSPVLLAAAACVRLESAGPVVFRQYRAGRGGRLFRMYKFRTMRADTPAYAVSPNDLQDPRVTRVGRFLRRWSLDELPQLMNVLLGDMSLVGPRPEMPFLVERYEPWQRERLSVRPGLTGLWQVAGRKSLPLQTNLEYDLYYVQNRGWPLDLMILLRTVPAVLSRRGAF